MSNSIAPGSSADVNVRVTALTTNPNVPAQYKTIILKKNLVNGVNTLTQEMMSATNTKYVIKYDYTLAENIVVPANCIFEFDGGSINGNGTNKDTITCTNTRIIGYGCFDKTLKLRGSIANECIEFDWWKNEKCSSADYDTFINNGNLGGAIPEISDANRTIFNNFEAYCAPIKFGAGIYPFDSYITIGSNIIFAEDKINTLLWAPNSDFAIMAGNNYGLVNNLTIEAKGKVFNVFNTQSGTPAHGNRFTNCTFISYEDNVIEKPSTGGNKIAPYGWVFDNIKIYGAPEKSSFVNLVSESMLYNNVEDAIHYFNLRFINVTTYGREISMFKNCNLTNFTNANLSYLGWKYFLLIDTGGMYYVTLQDTLFEGNLADATEHNIIANLIKTTVALTSIVIRMSNITLITTTFDVAPIWFGSNVSSLVLDLPFNINTIYHAADIGEPIANNSDTDIMYITDPLDVGSTIRRIGVIEKGVTPANAVRYNNTIALTDVVTSGYPQEFADLINSDGKTYASEFFKCCTRGKSFPTVTKTQTGYQFYRIDLGKVCYFNETEWVDATGTPI